MMVNGLSVSRVLNYIREKVTTTWRVADEVARSKAVETIEYECTELDNVFALLVLGAFVGLTTPPVHITLEMLPLMEKELTLMLEKVSTAHDPLGDLFSILEID